ncbi:MAG: bifunctional oligoribonuclease/PAP phosphatase NrnA [Candidatus Magasanikbacteria bacterium]
MLERVAKQIYNEIKKAEHILLVPHQNPDGDALGSATALMHFLKNINKDHTVFCATSAEDKLHFLPYVEELTTEEAVWEESYFDLVIVLDSGDLEYAGIDEYIEKIEHKPKIINIDHHDQNTNFGDLNLVIPSAASTTQILYNFFVQNNIQIDSYTATCLLTGILTDTDNFTNAATTVTSLEIAGNLVKKGGKIQMIKQIMFQDKSIEALKLWGQALSRLSKHDDHKIVYTYLTQDDLDEFEVSEEDTKGIANFMNALEEGDAALILKERSDGKIKGSFRTTKDSVDVSKIAQALGGGGHKKASGFKSEKNLEETLEQVWEAISKIKEENK